MSKFEVPRVRPAGKLFVEEADWWHNAVLEKFEASWAVYAKSYLLAADAAVEAAKADRSKLDFLIYSILFLYRQYLEISLKEILLYAEELRNGNAEVPATHDLHALWDKCRATLEVVGDSSICDEMVIVGHTVREYATIDPTSTTFRYPVDKKGSPSVQQLAERVNVRKLQEEMNNAEVAISMISGGLSALVDQKREFQGEWGL